MSPQARFLLLLVVGALACLQADALTPVACQDAAAAKALAKTALRYYYRQKQLNKWYCWPKQTAQGTRWTWKDNGNLISISTTALFDAANHQCYVMLTHSHKQANVFFGARRGDSDFQIGWKRPAAYAADAGNWHHGEITAARFLAGVDFADAAVSAYPPAESAAILALRGKVAAGTLSVPAIYPDRPFCEFCKGTAAVYGAAPAVAAGSRLPIAKQAACTAHSALLGQMCGATSEAEQITAAEKTAIDNEVKPMAANAACCTWELAGRPNPVPAGCGGDESDDEVDPDENEDVVCSKRKRTCKAGGDAKRVKTSFAALRLKHSPTLNPTANV